MKKLLLATVILSYALWSCKGGGGKDPEPATLSDSVNYTLFVKPIMTKSCNLAGCHSQGAGGIDLRTYFKVQEQTANGKLISSIKHESGSIPMPQGANKLSNRDILIIDTWKTKGYPEN